MNFEEKMPPLPKWSNKTVERFLEIYKKHPCLYDFEDVSYASKIARQAAMESILRELAIPGLSLLDLKRKIHSIRNTYTNECRKIERSKKSAAYPGQQYKPRSPWFYLADQVLGQVVLSRKDRRANNNDLFNKVQAANFQNLGIPAEHQEEYSSQSEACSSESYNRNQITSMIFEPADLATVFREAKLSTSTSRSYQQSTTDNVAPASVLENTLSAIPEVQCKEESQDFEYEPQEDPYDEHHTDMSFQNVEEDELETFARSVWLQMRKLPEEYNIQLMADIQMLISEKRREYLQTKNKYSSSQEKNGSNRM